MLSALFALLDHMYKDVAMAYTDLVYAQCFIHRWAIVTEKELFVHEKKCLQTLCSTGLSRGK